VPISGAFNGSTVRPKRGASGPGAAQSRRWSWCEALDERSHSTEKKKKKAFIWNKSRFLFQMNQRMGRGMSSDGRGSALWEGASAL